MSPRVRSRGLAFAATALFAIAACAGAAPRPRFGSLTRDQRTLTFEHNIHLFEVSGGLRVALIPDDRTNLATVDVRFAVGAAEDPAGKAGLAHLVEHLLFELRGRPDGPTLGDELGAISLHYNASTTWDATHYTATVPVAKLDEAIALEGRRLRATCAQLDEATFLRERDVVLAEEAERGAPLDDTLRGILEEIYGAGHPYTRPVSSTEVATATRADACGFIAQHYAPDRAYMVVTGPFDPDQLQALIGRTFGPIKRRSTAPRRAVAGASFDGKTTRHTAPIARPTALVFLPHPSWGGLGVVPFAMARDRLAKVLAAADVRHPWIVGTDVFVMGDARARVLVAAIEVDSAGRLAAGAEQVFELAPDLFAIDRRSLSRSLGEMLMGYVASWDDLGSRGEWIADFMQHTSHNRFMLDEMEAVVTTDWDDEARALQEVLKVDRSHVVLLTPRGGDATGTLASAVRSGSHAIVPWRQPVDAAEADRPITVTASPLATRVERYRLANGLTVELAPDRRSPLVAARLVFPADRAHEPADRANLADAAAWLFGNQFPDSYGKADRRVLSWWMTQGTFVTADVAETSTTFSTTGLALWGDWHVWFLSWMLDQGGFDKDELETVHKAATELAKTERSDVDHAELVFRERLFGAGHPYATPPPATGASYAKLTMADLEQWRRDHYQVADATLIVSGNFELAKMRAEIDELFAPLPATPAATRPAIPPTRAAPGPSWLAVDRPQAPQVGLRLGIAARSDAVADAAARLVLTEMLDDAIRDVREGMAASYGLHVRYTGGAAGGALLVTGAIDEAKAGVAVRHVLEAIARLRDDAAGQREAFVRARRRAYALALARMGGAASVAAELEALAILGLPVDHLDRVATQLATLTPADVARVAGADLAAERMVVALRGKRAAVDAAFTTLGVTPERPVDPAGPSPAPAPAPTPPPAKPERRLPEVRLAVGSPTAVEGPREEGLFLGERKLTLDEFLRTAGADDVRSRMRTRRWARRGMMGGGLVATGVGLAIALSAESCSGVPPREINECEDRRSGTRGTGLVFLTLGLLGAAGGSQLGTGAPSQAELREIADRYNAGLTVRGPARTAPTLALSPVVGGDGGGLVLSGWF